MNSMEKYRKMISLEPYRDRTEIPVFPLMITSATAIGEETQANAFSNVDAWLAAVDRAFQKVGRPDVMSHMPPMDAAFNMYLPVRAPGRELGDDELYQFIETPFFEDPAEYKRILEMGWAYWFAQYTMAIQTPAFTSFDQLGARYAEMGQHLEKTYGYIYGNGMMPWFDSGIAPIFDTLSMIRSMQEFLFDLMDDPGPIMDVVNAGTPGEIERMIGQIKENNGWRAHIFAMRSSATFLSPDMFEEYAWPAMKQMIEAFHAAGVFTTLHADSNWLPMLKYFTQLPKGCVHFELDGSTDIQAAYDILGGWQSIQGDVPATMLMMGTPDDVSEYCEKLIQMGMKGGFMLGSGCEVPMNAKPENVAAMIASVRNGGLSSSQTHGFDSRGIDAVA